MYMYQNLTDNVESKRKLANVRIRVERILLDPFVSVTLQPEYFLTS